MFVELDIVSLGVVDGFELLARWGDGMSTGVPGGLLCCVTVVVGDNAGCRGDGRGIGSVDAVSERGRWEGRCSGWVGRWGGLGWGKPGEDRELICTRSSTVFLELGDDN